MWNLCNERHANQICRRDRNTIFTFFITLFTIFAQSFIIENDVMKSCQFCTIVMLIDNSLECINWHVCTVMILTLTSEVWWQCGMQNHAMWLPPHTDSLHNNPPNDMLMIVSFVRLSSYLNTKQFAPIWVACLGASIRLEKYFWFVRLFVKINRAVVTWQKLWSSRSRESHVKNLQT